MDTKADTSCNRASNIDSPNCEFYIFHQTNPHYLALTLY